MQGWDNESGQKQSLRPAGLINAGKGRKYREIQLEATGVWKVRENGRRGSWIEMGQELGESGEGEKRVWGWFLDTEGVGTNRHERLLCVTNTSSFFGRFVRLRVGFTFPFKRKTPTVETTWNTVLACMQYGV